MSKGRIMMRISFMLLALLTFTGSMAQTTTNLEPKWEKVEKLLSDKGLTRSAITEVRSIYIIAKKEKQEAQSIKALVYLLRLENMVEDGTDDQSFTQVEQELKQAKAPAKQLLHSLMASHYWRYLRDNRWKLYDRNNVKEENKNDIATWSAGSLHKKISEHYLLSLDDQKLLQNTSLTYADPLLKKGNSGTLRPSLYDVLAHEALSYFTNDERDVSDPKSHYLIDEDLAFAPAEKFSATLIKAPDTTSLFHRALKIYQDILSFHLNDRDPSALIDADVQRLRFVRDHSSQIGKDKLFQHALNGLCQKYSSHPEGVLAGVERLESMYEGAMIYSKGLSGDSRRWEIVAIRKELEKIVPAGKNSEAEARKNSLLQRINDVSLSVRTDLVQVPGKPFLSLVSFKNLNDVHYRIIRLRHDQVPQRDQDAFWKKIIQSDALRQVQLSLPNPGDHREHSVEIPIESLPAGDYALLVSAKENFELEDNDLSLQFFHVTHISYVNSGSQFYLLNRETGYPLKGAEIRVLEAVYDPKADNGRTLRERNTVTTNGEGYTRINPSNRQGGYLLDIRWNGERLFTDHTNYYYEYPRKQQSEGARPRTALFTDRSIYRPGQIVYFKGICFSKDPYVNKTTVITGQKRTVTLLDANGQIADSLELVTNKYGSYSGQFRLPASAMTGTFTIRDEHGTAMIQVEEYKRPGFEVVFDPVREQVRANDTVTVKGSIRGYAGNNITGATVRYKVVRYPLIWRGAIWPPAPPVQIAFGETSSASDGSIMIRFRAETDPGTNEDLIYRYEVTAEATDKSGETRTGTKTLQVGQRSFQIKLRPDNEEYDASQLREIRVSAWNAEGMELNVPISLAIYALEAPNRLLRTRHWEIPDTSVLTKDKFIRLFPNDPYLDENDPATWKPKQKILQQRASDGKVDIGNKPLDPGVYLLEASAVDRHGLPVITKKIIRINDTRTKRPALPAYHWQVATEHEVVPGETAQLAWGSSITDLYVISEIRSALSGSERLSTQYEKDGWVTRDIVVGEEHAGGIRSTYVFVRHNRFYTVTDHIKVPFRSKELTVSVDSYRDKLRPGSKETWKLSVKGPLGEKISSELLTSMYDASLDQFLMHQWPGLLDLPSLPLSSGWELSRSNFTTANEFVRMSEEKSLSFKPKQYDMLLWSAYPVERGMLYEMVAAAPAVQNDAATPVRIRGKATMAVPDSVADSKMKTEEKSSPSFPLRKDFSETAFFLPHLETNENGEVSFTFTMPESLTQWKWMMLAHTGDLASGSVVKTIITQKELMVQPNMPRFLRSGDMISVSARISNLTTKEITGQAFLQLADPDSGKPVDGWFQNIFPSQYVTVGAGSSEAVHFSIQVPVAYSKPLLYRMIVRSGEMTDGEENIVPVLPNRTLVTESVPITVKGNREAAFELRGLTRSGQSGSITHERITVEYSTNPIWYAVLALPYLVEFPYECSEQGFNRLYANALASLVANKNPLIREYYNKWKNGDSSTLISSLMKNQQLKSILLEQTPWVLQAKNETEQRKQIAMLFDLERLSAELPSTLAKLREMQLPDGSFPWFKGGRDDRHITQYILAGFGRLQQLGALPKGNMAMTDLIRKRALEYADRKITEDHERLIRSKADLRKNNLGALQIQYLYARSFFREPVPASAKKAYEYFYQQAGQFWVGRDIMSQSMIALALNRSGNKAEATRIMRSLKENAVITDLMGMYWKNNVRGYTWHQSPIEAHALALAAFTEITGEAKIVEDLKLWLLNQKRVQAWPTTKSTADAVHGILLSGRDLLASAPEAEVILGDRKISFPKTGAEPGTGYVNTVVPGSEIQPSSGKIRVTVKGAGANALSWGAVHWQYFEDLDKVRKSSGTVVAEKTIYREKNTERGPVLEAVQNGQELAVGERLKVRIVLKADRDMEYMHLKDLRASGTEPVNVISTYKWQGGLGYYEATRDASTDFFFGWLPKGTWVFEYPLTVTHSGKFSSGPASIQSMYAPEFNAHSAGSILEVGASGK